MVPLETRFAFEQENPNMLGKKGDTKITHADQKTAQH